MISFTIDIDGEVSAYQADEGMTWYEWCASQYNIDAFTCELGSEGVYNASHDRVLTDDIGEWCYAGDIIANGANYSLMIQ